MTYSTAYNQLRSAGIPHATAQKLASGLAKGNGKLPAELLPMAKGALNAIK